LIGKRPRTDREGVCGALPKGFCTDRYQLPLGYIIPSGEPLVKPQNGSSDALG